MYDVAVIGLGPAGSFLLKHLKKDFRVVAIDKKREEGGFQKPCGGLLAPDAQKSLSRFNMTLPKDILVGPQIFSVRTIDLKSGLLRHYQRHYINLDRHKFDQWLIGQIPGHVEVCGGAVCTLVKRDENGFKITFSQDGLERTIRSKIVVGADGASSVVRHGLFPDHRIQTYLSIQQWFSDAHDTPFYSCVFDPELTDSYAWGLSKDGYFIFGGAFPVKGGKENFESLKGKLRAYGFQLDHPLKTEACLALRPTTPESFCLGGNDAFLIGEAAGFISPSSLEGISYAIDSGYLLSQCLNGHSPDPNLLYRKATLNIRAKLTMKNIKRPFMYHPLLRKLVMKSGLQSIPILT